MQVSEEPLYTVFNRPLLPFAIITAFFLGIGGLCVWSYIDTGDLNVLLVALLFFAFYSVIFVLLVFFVSKFCFYESYFVRRYRGKIRQRVEYSEVYALRYYKRPTFSRTALDSAILLSVRQNGTYLPFDVKGNPRNASTDMHLYDWLKTKVKTE